MTANFTHLHVHTQYSLLDGACRIDELVAYAKELGMTSLAITDHGVMYGVIEFYQECLKQGLKPIIGCEVYVAPGSRYVKTSRENYHLTLLAESLTGYKNLMQLVSAAQLEGLYYKPRLDKELLKTYHEGLICLSGCVAGEVPRYLINGNFQGARRAVEEYLEIFGKDNYFLEVQNHALEEERLSNKGLFELAAVYDLKAVATNDLHYVRREDAAAQDVLLCIQTNANVDDADRMRFPNDSFYLKSAAEMAELFPEHPEVIANSELIAQRCQVTLEFGRLLLPQFPLPGGEDADSYLAKLCEKSLEKRYASVTPAIRARLEYELATIRSMGYAAYFLIVWDFIGYARRQGIPVGPGRGSAAGSIVAYLLQITDIDPLRHKLLFERFLNPERVSMPDIDTDFCYYRRGEVIDYVVRRYGKERVSLIITYGTLAARAAVRDVGRVLGLSYRLCDDVAKKISREPGMTLERALAANKDLAELYATSDDVERLIDLARRVEGLPRNYGTHAAGVIIAPEALRTLVPLQLDVDGKNIITQYDKDRVESLGLLKMDFLGLRTLTVLADALKNIAAATGEAVDLRKIPLDDAATCAMLRAGDTMGVFQLESAGITKLVTQLEPSCFEDLIPLVALYRPGPLGTGMADDFIAGKHGHRTAAVLHPLMEPILADTYGVILYQEQVMQIASALAGFTLGQADILRRAMGKKKAKELDSMRSQFVEGAFKLHAIDRSLSEKIFDLLQHFAGYGFNKSHSVAYALVAYQTAYLKAHWPAHYLAAYLDSMAGDSEKLSYYIGLCRLRGLAILPPDVNTSMSNFSVAQLQEGPAIRFGLLGIKNVGRNTVEAIIKARTSGGAFKNIEDFCRRVSANAITKRTLENLIRSGAFDSFGEKRSVLLNLLDRAADLGAAYQRDRAAGQFSLFGADDEAAVLLERPQIAELPRSLLLQKEKELLGFYVTGHPLDNYRRQLAAFPPLYTLSSAEAVREGTLLSVAGIINACNLKLTKTGNTMAALTLEDFSGTCAVIVFPQLYRRLAREIAEERVVVITGRFNMDERTGPTIIADSLGILPPDAAEEAPEPLASERRLYLKINSYLNNPLIERQLRELFHRYKGNDPVYLYLEQSKELIRTEPHFWVDTRNESLPLEAERLLGKGSCQIKITAQPLADQDNKQL